MSKMHHRDCTRRRCDRVAWRPTAHGPRRAGRRLGRPGRRRAPRPLPGRRRRRDQRRRRPPLRPPLRLVRRRRRPAQRPLPRRRRRRRQRSADGFPRRRRRRARRQRARHGRRRPQRHHRPGLRAATCTAIASGSCATAPPGWTRTATDSPTAGGRRRKAEGREDRFMDRDGDGMADGCWFQDGGFQHHRATTGQGGSGQGGRAADRPGRWSAPVTGRGPGEGGDRAPRGPAAR